MDQSDKYTSARVAGREHIPLYPRNFIALRIVQLVLAVIIIGLAAFGVAGLAFDGDIFIMVVVGSFRSRVSHCLNHRPPPLTPSAGHLHPHRNDLLFGRRVQPAECIQLLGRPGP